MLRILIEAGLSTTSHGIANIIKAKHFALKITWAAFLLTSTGLCSYLVSKSIMNYLSFEVLTKTTVRNELPAVFPTVTICNRNAFVTEYGANFAFKTKNFIDPKLWGVFDYYYLKANAFNESDEEKQKFGFKVNETIFECFFNGARCDYEDFVWVYYANYGNCYRFNSGKNLKTIYRVGKSNGLNLKVYTGEPELNIGDISTGLHMFIHNASVNPSDFEGFDVSTGSETNIAINRLFLNKLEYPYSDCQRDLISYNVKNAYLINMLNTGYAYRNFDCFHNCFQQFFIAELGCYEISLNKLNGKRPCVSEDELINVTVVYRKYLLEDLREICMTKCPLECDSSEYSVSLSTGFYPSKTYEKALRNYVPYFHNLSSAEIRERTLSVNIYYETLAFTKIEEVASIVLVDLLASIGGTLGLFIGVSVLSFAEIFEIIFNLIVFCVKKSRKISTEL